MNTTRVLSNTLPRRPISSLSQIRSATGKVCSAGSITRLKFRKEIPSTNPRISSEHPNSRNCARILFLRCPIFFISFGARREARRGRIFFPTLGLVEGYVFDGNLFSRHNKLSNGARHINPRHIIPKIRSKQLMANYVARYFEDMYKKHLGSLRDILNKGPPVEHLFSDMFSELGFADPQINVVRKRNSKKELFEFDISAKFS